ncbi:MAG: DUF4271 domain-containing protein [Thermoflavifilum sp.]|nr:DUF4271 domain-containing protein [Thermoflavifilum sp.]
MYRCQLFFIFLILFRLLLPQVSKAQQAFIHEDTVQDTLHRTDSFAHFHRAATNPAQASTRQSADTIKRIFFSDSMRLVQHADSLKKIALAREQKELRYQQWLHDKWVHQQIFQHPAHPILQLSPLRPRQLSKEQEDDLLFYLGICYLFLLGFIRTGFQAYFNQVFQAFLHPTQAIRKLRDQLTQRFLPGMLMNFFFAISTGFYLYLILRYEQYTAQHQILLLVGALSGVLAVIYLVKYAILKLSGWLFGVQELTSGYGFILMLVNKVLGIVLVPFVWLLAFGPVWVQQVALEASLVVVIGLFLYRYVRSYAWVRQHMIFSRFHFFLYLCAFEVAPVLVMAKIILKWLHGGF